MHESLRVLIVSVLVAVIVVFDPRDAHPGGRPKFLLVVAGALAAALLLVVGCRDTTWRGNPLRWPLAGLVGWATLSTLASDDRHTAVYGFPGSYDGLLTMVCFAILFLAAAEAFRRQAALGAVRVLWFGAGTVVLLFGLAQLVDRLVSPDTGWDWARPAISPWTIGSTVGNPNHLAGLLAILLPLATVLVLLTHGRERRLVLTGIAVAVLELGITASRGAWMATIAAGGLLAYMFRGQLRPHQRRVAVTSVAVVGVLAVALVVLGAAGATKIDPSELARTGPGTTLDLRFEVWATAWRAALDHPVLGVGPDVFPVVFPAYETERFMLLYGPFTIANGAHNVFLNTLVNLGVGGLAAFVALLVVAGARLARAWPRLEGERRLLAAALAAAVLAYLVQACLNTQAVALSLCFWLLLGTLTAISSAPEEEVTHERASVPENASGGPRGRHRDNARRGRRSF